MDVMAKKDIELIVHHLLEKYHAEHAILFGSYARNEATADSDIDVVVVGGDAFVAKNIFAFGEDLRLLTNKNVDAFELREINPDTPFFETIMKEGVRIA